MGVPQDKLFQNLPTLTQRGYPSPVYKTASSAQYLARAVIRLVSLDIERHTHTSIDMQIYKKDLRDSHTRSRPSIRRPHTTATGSSSARQPPHSPSTVSQARLPTLAHPHLHPTSHDKTPKGRKGERRQNANVSGKQSKQASKPHNAEQKPKRAESSKS